MGNGTKRVKGKVEEIKGTLKEGAGNLIGNEQMRAEAMQELRDIQSKIAEYSERRVAAEDQLKRTDIRAPSDGHRRSHCSISAGPEWKGSNWYIRRARWRSSNSARDIRCSRSLLPQKKAIISPSRQPHCWKLRKVPASEASM